jgi:hypothetical protein
MIAQAKVHDFESGVTYIRRWDAGDDFELVTGDYPGCRRSLLLRELVLRVT